MSTWTHVVGCIRVDGIKGMCSVRDLEAALGPMCLFDAWNDDSTLPQGSEGGLRYKVIEYDTGLPWVAIPIWGDLRDYDDVEAIRKWWFETLPKLKMMVRDAVLLVQVGGRESVALTHEQPENGRDGA